jgi:hypothetical protein
MIYTLQGEFPNVCDLVIEHRLRTSRGSREHTAVSWRT